MVEKKEDKLKSFSIRFRTGEGITVFQQIKAKDIDEAIDMGKQIALEKNWKTVSVREFSAKKSEIEREPRYSIQALEKARVIGFTNVDFDKEIAEISDEEKQLYQAKTEAWNTYKSLCERFYADYSEQLEKQLQETRQKFDLALRDFNHFVNESYNTELGDIVL